MQVSPDIVQIGGLIRTENLLITVWGFVGKFELTHSARRDREVKEKNQVTWRATVAVVDQSVHGLACVCLLEPRLGHAG